MRLLTNFVRVSARRPCPICGKPDWCLSSSDDPADPSRVICARLDSGKRIGNAGWLHVLRRDPTWKPWHVQHRAVRLDQPDAGCVRWAFTADAYKRAVNAHALSVYASDLALSVESLVRLGVGWNGWAWSFPMTDACGRVVGIHLRASDGRKRSEKGSRLGLFVPAELVVAGQLLICEGQTDAAAMLDLGFDAIGRPGCQSTIATCVALARKLSAPRTVVVGDSDAVGRAGASALSTALAVSCPDVRVIYPPDGIKDAREWKRRGATCEDVLAAVESTRPRRLNVHVRMAGGGS